MDWDLGRAIDTALPFRDNSTRRVRRQLTWQACTQSFTLICRRLLQRLADASRVGASELQLNPLDGAHRCLRHYGDACRARP